MLQGLKGLPELEAHLVLRVLKEPQVRYKELKVLKERHSLVHKELKELRVLRELKDHLLIED